MSNAFICKLQDSINLVVCLSKQQYKNNLKKNIFNYFNYFLLIIHVF